MKDYIKKDSQEWNSFINEIMSIKSKSNRQVLCVKWWVLLNYEQKIKHIKVMQDHEKYILTSSKFASAWQISSLALAWNKIIYKSDGEYIKSPFQEITPNNPAGLPITNPQHTINLNEISAISSNEQAIATPAQENKSNNEQEEVKDEQSKFEYWKLFKNLCILIRF